MIKQCPSLYATVVCFNKLALKFALNLVLLYTNFGITPIELLTALISSSLYSPEDLQDEILTPDLLKEE